ncbi:hypothetical protein LXL04_030075 [Taraxacum kok-saghyz]
MKTEYNGINTIPNSYVEMELVKCKENDNMTMVSEEIVSGSNRVQSSESHLWETGLLRMLFLSLRGGFKPGFVGCYGILPYRMSLPTTPNRRSKKKTKYAHSQKPKDEKRKYVVTYLEQAIFNETAALTSLAEESMANNFAKASKVEASGGTSKHKEL